MSVYKRWIIITTFISINSLLIAIILNYGYRENFWCNVCLGLFGSSVLTLLTSIIGYSSEKRSCLEAFYEETLRIVNRVNRFQHDLSLEDKIEFFLNMADYDHTAWNTTIGKMDFFDNRQRDYIYEKIYFPLRSVDEAISKHTWQFRMHKNGTGRNEKVMESFVDEIEKSILEKKEYHYTMKDDRDYVTTSIHNKVVDSLLKELYGHYYEIMYGKKKARQMEEKNGKIINENN